MVSLYTTTICLDGDAFTEFEVEAVFEIDGEIEWDERGRKGLAVTTYELLHINFDGLRIGRSDVAQMIGRDRLVKIELAAAEEALQDDDWRDAQ